MGPFKARFVLEMSFFQFVDLKMKSGSPEVRGRVFVLASSLVMIDVCISTDDDPLFDASL